jgi:hypothetical protein
MMARLVAALPGQQRAEHNRARQLFAHARMIGEHTAKVNSDHEGYEGLYISGPAPLQQRSGTSEVQIKEYKLRSTN